MRLRSLMRRDVLCVGPGATLGEAAREMRQEDIGSLAVLENGRFAGIITERDLVQAVADGADPSTALVAAYMTGDPIVAAPDDGTAEVAARMVVLGVRHLPVLEDGGMVGMVSIRDLLEASALING